MKRNSNFLARQVAKRHVIVPVGEAAEKFSGMITLNGTGKFLWDLLEQEQTVESLAQALIDTYQISEELAMKDAAAFVEKLMPSGAIE